MPAPAFPIARFSPFYFIDIIHRLHGLHPLQDIAPHIEFAPIPIETVWNHTDNEITPQLLRSTKKVDVTLVEKGGGAGGDDF